MGKLDQDMDSFKVNNGYQFSGQRIGALGASEFTLAALVVDKSGSVASFKPELEKCMGSAVDALRKSPRADNLMLRTTAFHQNLEELHGFKTLTNVNPDDYNNILKCGGSTALYDGCNDGLVSLVTYGREMVKQDFTVNGILIVLTDGDDNASISIPATVRKAMEDAVRNETLESLVSILVGVNANGSLRTYLDAFHKDAGFSQFESLDNADAKTLARLSNFISKSVSAQSQALGTGGPSRSLSF